MTMDDSTRPNDLLLLAGKVVTFLMQGAMVIGAFALTVAFVALLAYQDTIIVEYAAETGNVDAKFPVMALAGVFFLGVVMVVAMFVFFGKLRAIINTVGEGDPFQPANADRLALMGWLMLGVQLLYLPVIALATQLVRFADELEDVNLTMDGGLDFTGVLMVIILFILARVFRHGAAMREDLEGTV